MIVISPRDGNEQCRGRERCEFEDGVVSNGGNYSIGLGKCLIETRPDIDPVVRLEKLSLLGKPRPHGLEDTDPGAGQLHVRKHRVDFRAKANCGLARPTAARRDEKYGQAAIVDRQHASETFRPSSNPTRIHQIAPADA